MQVFIVVCIIYALEVLAAYWLWPLTAVAIFHLPALTLKQVAFLKALCVMLTGACKSTPSKEPQQ